MDLLQSLFGDESDEEQQHTNVSTKNDVEMENNLKSLKTIDCVSKNVYVKSIDYVGGNRGVFAYQDLPAGTLIVLEVPTIRFQSDTIDNIATYDDSNRYSSIFESIINISYNQNASIVTNQLHPMLLSDADEEEIQEANTFLENDLQIYFSKNNISEKQEIENESVILSKDEIIRIFLVLQHNGFTSGLYEYLSLVNHSCIPNCIKFSPKNKNKYGYSEIWSIKPIEKDEEITICYITPMEMITSSMQDYLTKHHRFQCNCPRCFITPVATTKNINNNDLFIQSKQELVLFQSELEEMETEFLWHNSIDDNNTKDELMDENNQENITMFHNMTNLFIQKLHNYVSYFEKEGNRVKNLYLLNKRYPHALRVLINGPGAIFWG
eukprot:gene4928-6896_t